MGKMKERWNDEHCDHNVRHGSASARVMRRGGGAMRVGTIKPYGVAKLLGQCQMVSLFCLFVF